MLRKFAWTPILNAVNEREQGIKDALDAAQKAKLEMANLQADNEKLLQEARAEREAMIKEAREIKASMIAGCQRRSASRSKQSNCGCTGNHRGREKSSCCRIKANSS